MSAPLEPEADALARTIQQLAASGEEVSASQLLSPFMLSMAISARRIANALDRIATHHTPPPGQEVGGFSQAEHNRDDMFKDRLHDHAQDLRTDP